MVEREPITLMGIAVKTTNDELVFGLLWERFFNEGVLEKIPHIKSEEMIALYSDYQGDHTDMFSFMIGCPVEKVEEIPSGFVVKEIPGGKYGRIISKGEFPDSIQRTWNEIWDSDIKRAYQYDYEVYSSKFKLNPPEVDVYLSIEK